MRLAVAGKGGAGKTTLAATLARLAARAGSRVVAIDADSNPNLGSALGLGEQAPAAAVLPAGLVSRRLDGPALVDPVDEVLERVAVHGPDGVHVLLMGSPGHAGEGCMCAAHATVSALLAELPTAPAWHAVVDMEASPEHFSRGTARHVDTLLLVAEPYYRALETVRRMAELAAELAIDTVAVVANKVRTAGDAEAISDFCDRHALVHAGDVPWSDDVLDADRRQVPLVEAGAPAVIDAIAAVGTRTGLLGRDV